MANVDVDGPSSNEPYQVIRMINWDWNMFLISAHEYSHRCEALQGVTCVVINSLTALLSIDTRRVINGKQKQARHLVCFLLIIIAHPSYFELLLTSFRGL